MYDGGEHAREEIFKAVLGREEFWVATFSGGDNLPDYLYDSFLEIETGRIPLLEVRVTVRVREV